MRDFVFDTGQSDITLWSGIAPIGIQEKELIRSQPCSIVLFQGDQSRAHWVTDEYPFPNVQAEEGEYSTRTYIYFVIGCASLFVGIVLLTASYFLAVQALALAGILILMVSCVGFRQCLVRAENEVPREAKSSP